MAKRSPITRRWRSPRDIQLMEAAIYNLVKEIRPYTVRQVFYQLVSAGRIDKTENEYKSTVCRLLVKMGEPG